jgi:two-component system phosphate regulon response regulator PhoB
LKILVVEDNSDLKEVLDYILEDEGHEAVFCPDGRLLTELSVIKPNIILLDHRLVEEWGSNLCIRLKSDNASKNIPVILMSAMPNLPEIAEQCYADAYLEKPFNIETIIDLIKRFTK